MQLWKLRLNMIATMMIVIAITTGFVALILLMIGVDLLMLLPIVIGLNLFQWLIGPYIIDAAYRVRPLNQGELPWLEESVRMLAQKSGFKNPPKIMVSEVPLPNAFAYGSPLTGPRVAVTRGLLNSLSVSEVEAVLGHELGHLKHRDVQIMMFLSVLPALVYWVAISLYYSGVYSGSRRDRGNGGALLLIGMLGMMIYYVLTLLILGFSRSREYYADYHGSTVSSGGPLSLASALVKISDMNARAPKNVKASLSSYSSFRALLIADPESTVGARAFRGVYDVRALEEFASREVSAAESLVEALSTHPNVVKRVRSLLELHKQLYGGA
ncbi:MAG: M48 family metalloprotease [Candidatus Brockarchaeota archaeon]|nr:M48 family metalloprotease [Candidatus Brockarchaeota archaeon]